MTAREHVIKRMGKRAGVPRLHPHLLCHTAACSHLMRHPDPFALKCLLGHSALAMTQQYVEAVSQMGIVQADTVSIVDGLDTAALNRTPTKKPRVKAPRPIARTKRRVPVRPPSENETPREVSCATDASRHLGARGVCAVEGHDSRILRGPIHIHSDHGFVGTSEAHRP